METSFSIVMPNYNSLYLRRAIKSVINQTHKNWELIIVDNNSSNFPEKTIEEFKNEKILFFKYENNNIIGKSRNFAIKRAKYDWIAFLDSDDEWDKKKLSEVNNVIIKNNADIIFHGMYFLPRKLGIFKKIIKDKNESIKEPVFNTLIEDGNKIVNSSVVVKKIKLLDIGLISEKPEKFSWEDYDCWLRLSLKQNKFYFINKVLGYCWNGKGRVSNNSQSFKNSKNIMRTYKDSIYKVLEGKVKRPLWISRMYSNIFFENKSFKKSFYFLKKSMKKKRSLSLKYIYLFFILFFFQPLILITKKIQNKLKKIFNIIIIFKFEKNKYENLKDNNFTYNVFNQYNELRNCNNFFESFDNKSFFKRFKNNDKMMLLIDKNNNNIACYGWATNRTPHCIEEVNKKIHFDDGYVLYDFRTLNEYKNKKLYKLLLNNIISDKKRPLYIYSLSSNKKSMNAINNVGFKSIKKLTILSHDFL